MTATVLCVWSQWQGGQAATFTPDAITKVALAAVPSPLGLYTSFFMMSACVQALSAPGLCFQLPGGAVHFSEGNSHFFSRIFSFCVFPHLAFGLCFKDEGFPVPPVVSPIQCGCLRLAPRRGVGRWLIP